jgi:hypothetical protein
MDLLRHWRGHALRISYHEGQRLVNAADLKAALGCQTDEEVVLAMQALPEREKRRLASVILGVSPRDLVKIR